MKKLFAWLRKLFAFGETKARKKEYKQGHKLARLTALFMEANKHLVPNMGEYIAHPLHASRLNEHKKDIADFKTTEHVNKYITIAFGDSILDIPKKHYHSIPSKFNFAISGSWHLHMKQMAIDLHPDLTGLHIKNVVIGTLGGNPLLTGQDIKETIRLSIETLGKVRELYPDSRLIVYGLPPVYNIHATEHHFEFEQAIYAWVVNDVNGVFLPMQKKFGTGFMGLSPKTDMSNDGVHLTPKGVYVFDGLIQKAKTAPIRSLVD